MKTKRRAGLRLLALCYIAAVLLWCAWCGAVLARDMLRLHNGSLQPKQLLLDHFVRGEGVVVKDSLDDGGAFVTGNADTQFTYHPHSPMYITRVAIEATAKNRGGNEMVMYYITQEGQTFSERNKAWAQLDGQGRWVFDLGGRLIHTLRWDPDARGGIYWETSGVVLLNEPVPAWQYFVPGVPGAALLMAGPVWVWAVLRCVGAFVGPWLAGRRLQAHFSAPPKNGKEQ